MEIDARLLKYIRILLSSKSFNDAIKPLNGQVEADRLDALMDRFFIPKTRNNKIFLRGYLCTKKPPLKFTTHVNELASAKKPCRSPEISYPHFMIIVGEYMTPEEWMDAYKYFKHKQSQEKKSGMTSIIDKFRKAESRLLRIWKTIDLKLEVYRIYKEFSYVQSVCSRIADMKSSGTFPIKNSGTFDKPRVRKIIREMQELLEDI